MSTMTDERATVPDTQEMERQHQYNVAVAQRLQELSGEHHEQQKGWFRRALSWVGDKVKQAWNWFTGKIKLGAKWIAETTRKIWGSTKRTVKQVWDWSTDKAKRAWSWMKDKAKRAWNWTKINAKKAWNWSKVNGKKAAFWIGSNAKKAWGWGRKTWIGASIASRVASLAGVGVFGGLIGVPLLMVAGLGTAAFLLINNSAPVQSEDEKADEAYAEAILSKDVLLINKDQELALSTLMIETMNVHQAKREADQLTLPEHSFFMGALELIKARSIEKSTDSRDVILTKFKAREGDDFKAFIEHEVKAGMREAEIKVNKLLREHKVQEPTLQD